MIFIRLTGYIIQICQVLWSEDEQDFSKLQWPIYGCKVGKYGMNIVSQKIICYQRVPEPSIESIHTASPFSYGIVIIIMESINIVLLT